MNVPKIPEYTKSLRTFGVVRKDTFQVPLYAISDLLFVITLQIYVC